MISYKAEGRAQVRVPTFYGLRVGR